MTRSIYDINLRSLPHRAYVLRKNRNSSFAFEVVVVKDKVACYFTRVNSLTAVNHFIDKGSFTVVNVGNDGNVSNSAHSGIFLRLRTRESTAFFTVKGVHPQF